MVQSAIITSLLQRCRTGDSDARTELVELVHDELKRIADRQLRLERPGHTLQATALVNEAYLELFGESVKQWHDRGHFFAYAATVMRHILVHHARRKNALKRGGGMWQVTLTGIEDQQKPDDILELDEALTSLAEIDPRKSRIVELRYFGGLSIDELSQVMSLSPAMIHREMAAARGWLYHHMSASQP